MNTHVQHNTVRYLYNIIIEIFHCVLREYREGFPLECRPLDEMPRRI